MLRVLKVATPLIALTVFVPDNVPVAGLLPIAIVMERPELVMVILPAS